MRAGQVEGFQIVGREAGTVEGFQIVGGAAGTVEGFQIVGGAAGNGGGLCLVVRDPEKVANYEKAGQVKGYRYPRQTKKTSPHNGNRAALRH